MLAQGKSQISRLPPYLTVQMVRFFYKVDVQQKAKILRKVCLLWLCTEMLSLAWECLQCPVMPPQNAPPGSVCSVL